MNLYLESGYADMASIINIDVPFKFVIGGRGTGKTYGALQYVTAHNQIFGFMRRTQAQIDMLNKPEFSPFKALQYDNPDLHIGTASISKYNAAFYRQALDGETWTNTGAPIGYTFALSTISNMRGFDASDISILIYDEFIPEKHERPLKNEGDAFLNAYETINRNRELTGRQPLQVVCMTNANDLACPLFDGLNMIDTVDRMCRKGKTLHIDKNRGIAVIMLQNSPISDRKANTALYKLAGAGNFVSMSLNNNFSAEDYEGITARPLGEYKPLCVYDDVCIYQHKSRAEFYVCRTIAGSPDRYRATSTDRARFKIAYNNLWLALLAGRVYFSDYYCKNRFMGIYTA